MKYEYDKGFFGSLQQKLQVIADGQAMDLTPEEALVYGIDYTDEYPDDTSEIREDYDG